LSWPAVRVIAFIEGLSPVYVPSGHLVFGRDNGLFAAAFDATRLVLTGRASRILDGVRSDGNDMMFAVALDGTLAYVPNITNDARLMWFDRQGRSRPLDAEVRPYSHPRISPDGTRVVVTISRQSGNELWLYDAVRGTRVRLTAGGNLSRAVWSADGKRITFQREGKLHSMSADGSDEPQIVIGPDDARVARTPDNVSTNLFPLGWSHDGRVLIFSVPAPVTNRDVWMLRDDGTATPFLATPRDERAATFSPDGRWVVYAAKETGREEQIYVQPFPGPGGREVISPNGGIEPVWSRSGREIFYRSVDGSRIISVDVRTDPFSAGTPRTVFAGRFHILGGSFFSNYDVSPNGQSFLMLESDQASTPRLNVVMNGLDALRAPQSAP
jgi:Tol biopolymer transport system component